MGMTDHFLAAPLLVVVVHEIRDAVHGNVGSIISFCVGYDDAALLEEAFAPDVAAAQFLNLKRYQMWARILENGLPGVVPLRKGERVMLDSKRLETFYRELQTPSRIEANTPTPQMEDREEDPKSQLTQS